MLYKQLCCIYVRVILFYSRSTSSFYVWGRGAPDIRLSGWDPVFWAIRQPDIRWPDNGLSENRIPDIRLRILGIT